MKENRKKIILIAVSIILLVVVVYVLGRSFGLFTYARHGESVNVVTVQGLDIDILSAEASLSLNNAYPIGDSEALTSVPFQFTMTNTTSGTLSYSVLLIEDEEKMAACVMDDGSSCVGLDTSYIKFSYKKNNESYTTPSLLSTSNNVVARETLAAGESISASILLWIDSSAGNDIMGQTFIGKIIIQGDRIDTQ